jgi:hypothetical protein
LIRRAQPGLLLLGGHGCTDTASVSTPVARGQVAQAGSYVRTDTAHSGNCPADVQLGCIRLFHRAGCVPVRELSFPADLSARFAKAESTCAGADLQCSISFSLFECLAAFSEVQLPWCDRPGSGLAARRHELDPSARQAVHYCSHKHRIGLTASA